MGCCASTKQQSDAGGDAPVAAAGAGGSDQDKQNKVAAKPNQKKDGPELIVKDNLENDADDSDEDMNAQRAFISDDQEQPTPDSMAREKEILRLRNDLKQQNLFLTPDADD
jgi:hypothetical protein